MLEPDARICSFLGMLASAAISGCVGVPERSTHPTESRADEIIAEAMRETAKANRIAADLEKQFAGLSPINRRRIESEAEDDSGVRPTPFVLHWKGPIEPLARSLAESSGIKFRISGTPPAHPVFVSVRAENVDLNEAVEWVNAAAFGFADLWLDNAASRLELRYPINE